VDGWLPYLLKGAQKYTTSTTNHNLYRLAMTTRPNRYWKKAK